VRGARLKGRSISGGMPLASPLHQLRPGIPGDRRLAWEAPHGAPALVARL